MSTLLKTIVLVFLFSPALLVVNGCKTMEFESALIYITQNNDWEKAKQLLEISLKKNPGDVETYILLVECFAALEQYREMDAALDSALLFMADSSKEKLYQEYREDINYLRDEYWCYLFNKGVDDFENNRFADAGMDFSNCIIIDSKRPEAYINLALVEEKINNIDSAIVHYEKAFQLDSTNQDIMFYVADLYINQEEYQQAIRVMDKLLSVNPNSVEAIVQKAIAYDFLGESDKAIAEYKRALTHLPRDTDLLFNVGRLYFYKGDYTNAIDYFNKILRIDPQDTESIVFIGDCYFSLGEDIMIELRETQESDSLKLSPQKMEAEKKLADEYFQKAIVYLELAIDMNSDDPDVWNMLAIAYSNLGMKDKAQAIFNKEESIKHK